MPGVGGAPLRSLSSVSSPSSFLETVNHIISSLIIPQPDNVHLHSAPPVTDPKVKVALVNYAGSCRLWDAYRSILTVDGMIRKEMIVKTMCPDTYDDKNVYSKELSQNSKHAGYREAVPEVYGFIYGAMCLGLGIHGGYQVRFGLMEDFGEPIAQEEGELRDLPLQDKLQIPDLYRQLHAVRVIHRDIQSRHIRRRADGRFALIDFKASRLLQDCPQGDRVLKSEARWVERILNL
ncbi:hypothetical protein IAR50_005973 [Cryptococcus sp. DSM 104548]